MGRAIVSGGFLGLLVSGLILAVVSQQAERRMILPDAPAAVPETAADKGDDTAPKLAAVAPETPAEQAPADESPSPPKVGEGEPAPTAPAAIAPPAEVDAPPETGEAGANPPAPETVAPLAPPAAPDLAPQPDAAEAPPLLPEGSAPLTPPTAADPTPDAANPPAVAEAPGGLTAVGENGDHVPGLPVGDVAGPGHGRQPALPAPDQSQDAAPPLVAGPPAALPPGPGPVILAKAPPAPAALPAETTPHAPSANDAPARIAEPNGLDGPGPLSPEQTDAGTLSLGSTTAPEPAPKVAPVVAEAPLQEIAPPAPTTSGRDAAAIQPDPVAAPVSPATTPEMPAPPLPPVTLAPPATESTPAQPAPPDAPEVRAKASPALPADGTLPPAALDQPASEPPAVITDRLPRIGDTREAPPEPRTSEPTDEVIAADALTRNGVAFDNPDGRPIVAVILLDQNGPIVNLPLTVSVAIDAGAPDAATRAAAYRAAGVEVVLIPALPEGAQPGDVLVALQDTFARIPDAVALIDTPGGATLGDRDALGQVISELSATGHGLITFPKGLNTAQQVAARAGVTAALVFREIDGEGQDLKAVKRFLDQAAFRARQENAVILVGHNQPETLAALTEWSLGNRAASVALAPVSAALKTISR